MKNIISLMMMARYDLEKPRDTGAFSIIDSKIINFTIGFNKRCQFKIENHGTY